MKKQTKKETEVIIQELAKRQIEKDQNKKLIRHYEQIVKIVRDKIINLKKVWSYVSTCHRRDLTNMQKKRSNHLFV